MWKIVFFLPMAVFAVGLGAFVGGREDIDVNDDGATNASNFAVAEYNRGSNSIFLSQVVKVIKAERQVVAGIKYFITVEMATSTCRKDGANGVCGIPPESENARPHQCIFTVWSRPWMSELKLMNKTCTG